MRRNAQLSNENWSMRLVGFQSSLLGAAFLDRSGKYKTENAPRFVKILP